MVSNRPTSRRLPSERNNPNIEDTSSALLYIPDSDSASDSAPASGASSFGEGEHTTDTARISSPTPLHMAVESISRQRSHIDDAVRALMSILSNESKLSDVNAHQGVTLRNLQAMKHNLTDMNKTSNEQYQACVTDFLRAARQARQAKDDLNDISRRLANIKNKLAVQQQQQ